MSPIARFTRGRDPAHSRKTCDTYCVTERANLNNIGGWQLLATAFEDSSQKAKCYRQILRIDSNNAEAAQALQLVSSPAKNRAEAIPIATRLAVAELHAAIAPPKFSNNQEVQLQNEPRRRGIILGEPIDSNGRWQYEVFFGDEKRYVAEADLLVVSEFEFDASGQIVFGKLKDLLRHLALVKLRNPLSDNLYSLYASRTKFEVYQFKPALKFLRNPDQRLLIADEVGLGKTIEAGIIFLELQARLDIARVLVVCPSGLRTKWCDEMRLRFDETFTILNPEQFNHFLQSYRRNPNTERLKGIVSLEMIRRQEFADILREYQVHFDLVIIDEAHHCRNTGTLTNEIAHVFSEIADAMLLLTATPINLGDENLFELLRILNPEEFDNYEAFKLRLEPNTHINAAARLLSAGQVQSAIQQLRRVEMTSEQRRFSGNPYYDEILRLLQQKQPSPEDLIAAQRRIFDLNTIANIFTRTLKRNVQEKTPIRAVYKRVVCFTPVEQKFYNIVIKTVRRQFIRLTGSSWASAWAVIMRARQAASCISAMRERLQQELARQYIDSIEDEVAAQEIMGEESHSEALDSLENPDLELLNAAKAVEETDTKFEEFLRALEEVLREDANSDSPRPSKVLESVS